MIMDDMCGMSVVHIMTYKATGATSIPGLVFLQCVVEDLRKMYSPMDLR